MARKGRGDAGQGERGTRSEGQGGRREARPPVARWRTRRNVAALLAILVPGLGHVYAGRPRAGLVWFCAIALGDWILLLPGVVLHALSIWSADRTAWLAGGGVRAKAAVEAPSGRRRRSTAGA